MRELVLTPKFKRSFRKFVKRNLTNLLEELYSQPPMDEITDAEIMNEIKAVRQQSRN